jgi:hypothetical protein
MTWNPFKLRSLLREALADRDELERIATEAHEMVQRMFRLYDQKAAPAPETETIVAMKTANGWVN